MSSNPIFLQLDIILPAFLAGLLVLSTHVPMGQEVLRRGIIFLDLAIAQMAAFGLIIAGYLGIGVHEGHASELISQLIAVSGAVASASLFYRFRNAPARIQEALIGVLFMLAATGSVLVLAKDPHGGERLKEIMVGQILWVEYTDLLTIALIYSAVLFIWFKYKNKLGAYGFYPLFAITITLSTQLVGVYLVFASLIVPALGSLHRKKSLLVAYSIGFLGYTLGLLASAIFDVPSGPIIAWLLAALAAGFYVITQIIDSTKGKKNAVSVLES